MNKIWLFGASLCMVLALGSCKPKQSAYKAAYEQAKEKETTAPVEVVEEYGGEEYTVINYMLDDVENIVEFCFWTIRTEELAAVEEIVNTISVG